MKFNRALIFGLVLVAIVLTSSAAIAQKKTDDRIKVCVFSATGGGGFRDPLTDSAKDIEGYLYRNKNLIGASRSDADVTIEVVERRGEALAGTAVFFKLTAGSYSLETSGQDHGDFSSWRGAAADVASVVDKWIKRNHDRLIALRVQK